ncbi:hypothetical protein OEA41_002082 [Lepraria neglecta]|uniref:RTA1-domain-containing protein n=1 Tax=Lepraria neglecta TaxID=209136 RepID=A0AAD9ZBY6_9LECA|nr:hypothetical protein OEA41_002082 [Lepraria neglecta]
MASIFPRDTSAYDLKGRLNGCVAYHANAKAPAYGYDPHAAPGVMFTLFFVISMLVHLFQTVVSPKWGYLTFAIGALASCFFSAAIYYILCQLIKTYGRRYSLLPPKLCLIIFCPADVIYIFAQAIGGSMAAKAASQSPPGDFNTGTHVMLGGIYFQLVSMSIFCVLWLLFLFRARKVPYSRIHALTTSFATACIMVRNVYRAVELCQGWTGYLITHEVYFCVLDGGLMALATLIMNFFHPSRCAGE